MNYNLQGFKELQYGDWQLDLQRTTTWWTTNATYWIWYRLNDLHRICSEDIKTGSLNIKIKFCGIHGEKSTWIHQFYCCLYPQFYNWNLEEISLSIKSFISMVLLFIALIFFFTNALNFWLIKNWGRFVLYGGILCFIEICSPECGILPCRKYWQYFGELQKSRYSLESCSYLENR